MKKIQFILIAFILSGILFSCGNKDLGSSAGIIHYTHRKADLTILGPAFLKTFNEKLYNAVINAEIVAYMNDSLSEFNKLTAEEAKLRGSWEEVIEIALDPENPDYLMDTTVINYIRLTDIKGYETSEAWIYNKGSNIYQAQPNAFALRYEPYFGGVSLPEQALFWIDYQDLEKVISKEDLEKLNELFFNKILEKLSDY